MAIRHSSTWVWVAMTLSRWTSGLNPCETLRALRNVVNIADIFNPIISQEITFKHFYSPIPASRQA